MSWDGPKKNEHEGKSVTHESLSGLNKMNPSTEREERSLAGIGNLRPNNSQGVNTNQQSGGANPNQEQK